MGLQIERWDHPELLIELRLRGSLDRLGGAYLQARLRDALLGETPPTVVVSLEQVVYLDAVGIDVLLEAARLVSASRSRLVLVIQEPRIRALLAAVGLANVFAIAPDLEQVLAECRSLRTPAA